MEKNTGKVREFCQLRKVGTLENKRFIQLLETKYNILFRH